MELSTSSEIALAVPLYPESRVAWMNLSSAMIEQSARGIESANFGVATLTEALVTRSSPVVLDFLRGRNRDAASLAVSTNQHLDHVRYRSVFKVRSCAERFF